MDTIGKYCKTTVLELPGLNKPYIIAILLLFSCRSVQRFWKACVMAALERLKKRPSYTGQSVIRSTPIRWPSCPQATRKTWRLLSMETSPRKLRSWPMICEQPKRVKDWGRRRWNGKRCGTATVEHPRRLPLTAAVLWGTSCDLLRPQKLQLGLTDNDCVLEWRKKRRGVEGEMRIKRPFYFFNLADDYSLTKN